MHRDTLNQYLQSDPALMFACSCVYIDIRTGLVITDSKSVHGYAASQLQSKHTEPRAKMLHVQLIHPPKLEADKISVLAGKKISATKSWLAIGDSCTPKEQCKGNLQKTATQHSERTRGAGNKGNKFYHD